MTGWRLGWCAAPEPIAKAIDAVQSHSTSNPTSFAQKGAVAALTGPQDHLKLWLAEFNKRRTYAWTQAQQHPRPDLRQRQRRLLPLPEHRQDRPQVHRLLRPAARSRESRRRPRHRLRRRRLHPPQLRHQHGQHPEGPGAHRTVLQGAGEVTAPALGRDRPPGERPGRIAQVARMFEGREQGRATGYGRGHAKNASQASRRCTSLRGHRPRGYIRQYPPAWIAARHPQPTLPSSGPP